MRYRRNNSNSTAGRSLAGFCLALLMLTAAPSLFGQVSPIDDSQAGVLSNLDQSTMYPIQTQMAETSNQNRLNENADTSKYTDNTLTHRPFYFSLEAMGIWTTNLERTYDNVPSISGEYVQLAAPMGVHLTNSRSDFNAFFRVDTNIYPGYTYLNHTSEVYSHQFVHQMSNITTSSWSLAGGHVVSLGQYLSPVISVGSSGVVIPQQTGGLQATNDAATTYTLAHQTSERNTLTVSGTAGWIDQPVVATGSTQLIGAYRQITGGGVLQWQRALNTRQIAGVEVTDVYVKGLTPTGDSNFTAAKFTFSQTLTPHAFFTGGIGPLYVHSNVTGTPIQNDVSYAANASIDYNQLIGHISGGYSRIYAVGYLSPSSVANELYLTFNRPLTRKLKLTADTQYINTTLPAQQTTGTYSQVGFTSRLDMYLTRNFVYQIGGSIFQQDATSQIPGYRYDNFSGGITYYFGHAPSPEGVQ
jgi:hypothetical protein